MHNALLASMQHLNVSIYTDLLINIHPFTLLGFIALTIFAAGRVRLASHFYYVWIIFIAAVTIFAPILPSIHIGNLVLERLLYIVLCLLVAAILCRIKNQEHVQIFLSTILGVAICRITSVYVMLYLVYFLTGGKSFASNTDLFDILLLIANLLSIFVLISALWIRLFPKLKSRKELIELPSAPVN